MTNVQWKLVLAGVLLLFYTGLVWKIHDWYDAKTEVKIIATELDNRVKTEAGANKLATEAQSVQEKDKATAQKVVAKEEKEIAKNKSSYDCIVPVDGVRIRNSAASTSASKP